MIIILFAPLNYYLYNLSFYENLYEKNNVYRVLDKNDVKEITLSIFDFFKYNKPLESFGLESGHQYFNKNEISHLNDVRVLLKKIIFIFYVSLALFLILLIVIFEKKYLFYIKNIGYIFLFSSCVLIFFLVSLYFLGNNFPYLFENFHYIFFPQGNWAFPENTLIITIFPFGFFYDFFFKLLGSSFIISIILFIFAIILLIVVKIFIKREKGTSE